MNNRRLNRFFNKNSRFGNFPISYKSLKLWRHQYWWIKFSRRQNCANFQGALQIHSSGIWHPPLILPLPIKETRWYFWKLRCRKPELSNWLPEFFIYFGSDSCEKSPTLTPFPPRSGKKPLKSAINWIITGLHFHRKSPPFFPLAKIVKINAIQGHHALRAHRKIGLARVWTSRYFCSPVFQPINVSNARNFQPDKFIPINLSIRDIFPTSKILQYFHRLFPTIDSLEHTYRCIL